MDYVGYEYLRQALALSAFPCARPAIVKPVTRVTAEDSFLAVPRNVAPTVADPLKHVLFALKHEGTNLQILAEAIPQIPADSLLQELRSTPSGQYIRIACYLWEEFTGLRLDSLPDLGRVPALVFDPVVYVAGPTQKSSRWSVHFNGLGTTRYCATVRRTPQIARASAADVLGRTSAFLDSLGPQMMDRALTWAYLHETEDTYAIERETPSEEKAKAFVRLLHLAHERRPLTEDYLIELQHSIVSNPYGKAAAFRTEQNWLRGPSRGAAGITYLPPPPALVAELMHEIMAFANSAPRQIDPIIAAAVVSFGFVYIHPFMDGNGRLSRFLFHQALCQSGRLQRGLLLPVSVAMKRSEVEYLEALQTFSRPARELWSVRQIDETRFDTRFNGSSTIYRYWDATTCAEFSYRMAEQALEVDLRRETEFLAHYDAVFRAVNDRFDIQNNDLVTLVTACLNNGGRVSNRWRKQMELRVPAGAFDFVEETARRVLEASSAKDGLVGGSADQA